MEAMAEMPDKCFDLAIVDPPYGIGDIRDGGHDSNRSIFKYKKVTWNDSTPTEDYFKQLMRVSKNRIIWGFQYYMPYLSKSDVGVIVFDKDIPMSTISQVDVACCSFHNRTQIFKYKWHGFIKKGDSEYDHQRIHPCEKPVALYLWLLDKYAKPGDKILDTHGGSMSIAIACHDLGFDLELYEIDKDYFEAGQDRLMRHQQQLGLFDNA
jgi:site-specific DNA-methyltransferase (adenine-specific)